MEKIVDAWTNSNKDIEDLEMLIKLCDDELLNCPLIGKTNSSTKKHTKSISTKVELLFHRFLFELIKSNSSKFSIITKILSKQIVCNKIDDTNGVIKLYSNLDDEELGYCYYYHTKRSFKINDWEACFTSKPALRGA